jgi:hypothetical protein
MQGKRVETVLVLVLGTLLTVLLLAAPGANAAVGVERRAGPRLAPATV